MSERYKIEQCKSLDYSEGDQSLPNMTSSKSRTDVRENKEIRIRKLLGLLSTDVQELTSSILKDLKNEQSDFQRKENEIILLKNKNKSLQDEIKRLKFEVFTAIQNEADAKIKTLQRKISEFEKQAEQEKRAREEAEKKYQEGKNTNTESLKVYQQTIDQQKNEIQTLVKKEREAKEELLKRRAIVETLSEQNDNIEKQLKKTQEELNNVRDKIGHTEEETRENLTDNIPNIADLSDKNRPTKLAERFKEIYRNEWKDAFEVFGKDEGTDDDEKIASILFSILIGVKRFCVHEAENQMKQIQCALTQEANPDHNIRSVIPPRVHSQLKDCAKSMAELSGKNLYKKFEEKLKFFSSPTARKANKVPKYLEACFNVCWMMAIQDPPVVFGPDINKGDVCDTDVYEAYKKEYKKDGNIVEYAVWPALLLHTNGPVLRKGVAECVSNSSEYALSIDRGRELHNNTITLKDRSNDMHINVLKQNDQYIDLSNDQKPKNTSSGYETGARSCGIYGTPDYTYVSTRYRSRAEQHKPDNVSYQPKKQCNGTPPDYAYRSGAVHHKPGNNLFQSNNQVNEHQKMTTTGISRLETKHTDKFKKPAGDHK